MNRQGESSRAIWLALAFAANACASAPPAAHDPIEEAVPQAATVREDEAEEGAPVSQAAQPTGGGDPEVVEVPAGEPATARAPVERRAGDARRRTGENPLRDVESEGSAERSSLCREPVVEDETTLETTRRRLYLTLCGAAVWFDGLFGDEDAVAEGQNVRGRVEISTQYTEYWGFKARGRLRVRADLPHFERRMHAFVGRENEDEFVADRIEGLALRSQFFEIENDDRWVAGLGYGLPGTYRHKNDVRVGARVRLDHPDVFVQFRHRRNWFLGERSAWRFRETLFYTVQDGFGSTTSIDFDHIINRKLLGRVGTVGTFSEATEGVRWRSAMIFYRSLRDHQALAQETYVRGETDREVQLREYGVRLIYRRPILGRDWLFGELVTGYGWVREKADERRQGSALVGFGVDLLFGRGDPY